MTFCGLIDHTSSTSISMADPSLNNYGAIVCQGVVTEQGQGRAVGVVLTG